MTIRRVAGADPALVPGLRDLLIDSVHGGASVGFLAPLPAATADLYWNDALASLGPGRVLWIAEEGASIVGAVQLAPCEKANGRHRGEIQKLMVHSAHRGKGIAAKLMGHAEAHARAHGMTLLVLDTICGSDAAGVYRHLGWTKAGEIPEYAANPDGSLHATCYFFKQLR